MDKLFSEIKNFLKKLELGQLEISQGHWELYKDVSCLKKSFEEFKKIKDDVENMKSELIMIKQLQGKFDNFRKYVAPKQQEQDNWSQYTKNDSSSWESYGSKSQKSDSCTCSTTWVKQRSFKSWAEGEEDYSDETPNSEANESSASTWTSVQKKNRKKLPKCMRKHICTHHHNSSLLHRYLQDTNLYFGRRTCNDNKSDSCNLSNANSFGNQTFQENTECGKSRSLDRCSSNRYVISEGIICPTCPRKFDCGSYMTSHSELIKLRYSCSFCKKMFKTKDLLKAHKATHKHSNRSLSYRCGYCKEGCKTLKNLTRHLRNCRNIMRSHFSKQEL